MVSFTCCKCLKKIPGGVCGLFTHLKFVHLILTSTCTIIICAEGACKTVLWRGSSYKRHLIASHMSARNERCNERQNQDRGDNLNIDPREALIEEETVDETHEHTGGPEHGIDESDGLNIEPREALIEEETMDETHGHTGEPVQDINDSIAVFILVCMVLLFPLVSYKRLCKSAKT